MPESLEVLTIVKKDIDEAGNLQDLPNKHPAVYVQEITLSDFARARLDPDIVKQLHQKTVIAGFKLFTKPGDNHVSGIAALKYSCADVEIKHTPYVAKIRVPGPEWFELLSGIAFSKEIEFYEVMLPLLNEILNKINLEALKFPKFTYSMQREMEKVIFFENLVSLGYKMADRKAGLDFDQSSLVLKEMGRLHAASHLLFGDRSNADLLKTYPMLEDIWHKIFADETLMDTHFTPGVKLAITLMTDEDDLASLDETEKSKRRQIVSNLEKLSSNVQKEIFKQLESSAPFRVLCHGDCWTNNFLFKDDSDGNATSCYMLDAQIVRIGSPALDLNHFFWISVSHGIRKERFKELLEVYYASFKSIFTVADQPMPFTFEELQHEFKSKNLYGFHVALMVLAVVLVASENLPKLEDFNNDMELFTKEFEKVRRDNVKSDPKAKETYIALLDEMYENGFLSKTENELSEPQAKRSRAE